MSNTTNMTHDPQRVVEDLRNQLAAPDVRISFLFGAGTSYGVNIAPQPRPNEKPRHEPLIPAISGLTKLCKSAVCGKGTDHERAWKDLEALCKEDGVAANVENILSRIQSRIEAIGSTEKLSGLDRASWKQVDTLVRQTISGAVQPALNKIPKHLPHDNFAQWVRRSYRRPPLEIFTLNYDLLLESALERAEVPVFDGFLGSSEPFFCPDSLEREELCPSSGWTLLWKVHGSVNWDSKEVAGRERIVRTVPNENGKMILPSRRKYDESRKLPYTALMDRLGRVLDKDGTILVTSGYSFGDEHVNSVILTVLNNRPRANLLALIHGSISEDAYVFKMALTRKNFTLVARNGGIVRGEWGEWKLTQPVDDKTCSFMDIAFDSHAAPEPTKGAADPTDESLLGTVKLGDFACFCKFLLTMERETEMVSE